MNKLSLPQGLTTHRLVESASNLGAQLMWNSRIILAPVKIIGPILLSVLLLGCSTRARSVTAGGKFLYVELWANNGCPRFGETVTLRATARNGGSDTQIVELKDQPVLDIIVGNPDNSKFRWSAGKSLTSELTRLELKPRESKSIEMQWRVDGSGTVISAQFIPNTQSIGNPFSALMVLGAGCAYFTGP